MDPREQGAEEALIDLQGILDEVVNGRTEGHRCPFCRDGELVCEVDEASVHLECSACGRTFDGRLGG